MAKLPADGTYYVHLGDTARSGGEEYGYRLRISAAAARFRVARRAVQRRAAAARAAAPSSVHVIRKDGFTGPIKLGLKDPPPGFSAAPVTLSGSADVARLTIKTDLAETKQPVNLVVEGRAKIDGREVVHEAVPAEDRMQAFLWRHLVPAEDRRPGVFAQLRPPPRRVLHVTPMPPRRAEARRSSRPLRPCRSSRASSPRSRCSAAFGRSSSFSKRGF